ncbi:dipeptidase [Solirubrobacter soli]|uniref:dipeptidase n=1 Tax=Solirubrobacter soli TaxID=363832 RepID=UPI000415248B|nr:membrane dipeptidase [Solirubrobacter soli]
MIADLHCHFPMHLVEALEEHPRHRVTGWLERLRQELDAEGFAIARRLFNAGFTDPWRVSSAGLREGGAGIVCSVLYWPFYEFQIGAEYGSPPDPRAFAALLDQLDDVEERLAGEDIVVVKRAKDLDEERMRFVHCVEGGFHLGPNRIDVEDQIRQLADAGVAYITLAHLFYRGVAADAPAIPVLSDHEYNCFFRQPEDGLPALGRAVIEAMCEHHVVVDLSHMRPDVIAAALKQLDELDPDRRIPVIASHVGVASAGPAGHTYNLGPETIRSIAGRNGVIGLITGQHLLGETKTPQDSVALLCRHIDAIHDLVGSHDHTAIGTDLDGFIKPTLSGLERAEDLAKLEGWIRNAYPSADADKLLHGNVERVLRTTFALRERG